MAGSQRIADRLLASEHAGCATWAAVAVRFGCGESVLRAVRAILKQRGTPVGLIPPQRENGPTTKDETRGPATTHCKTPGRYCADCECDYCRRRTRELSQRENLAAFDAAPDVPVVPPSHAIHGVSSYVVAGEVRGQWIKTTAVNDERAQWLDAIRSLADLPRFEPAPAPEYNDADLLAVYPVGDPHVGLLSWHEDAGENFDLEIAERNLAAAFDHLTALAPNAAEALLIFIGDNDHADGQSNTTTKGTRVDVDGRAVKRSRTSIRIGRHAVDRLLRKHGRVRMIWERGNHDELIAAMTALAFSLIYENDPRVTVDVSPEMFHWFRFGKNLIGTHHGDKVKPMDLLGVMAVDRQQDWGETTHRRFYLGHYHHQMVKEVPGLICEYLPTLASSDAWHRSMGYRSQRAMYMDTFHREHGHVLRHVVGISQLRAA